MNVYAWVLFAAFGVAAGTSWAAMAAGRVELEKLTRTVVAALLLALAWLLHADTVGYGRLLLLGLALGLLAGPLAASGRRPTAATAVLLASRAAYLAAMTQLPAGEGPVWLGVVAVLVPAATVAWLLRLRIVPALRERWQDGAPPLGYALLVAAVPLAAWWSGHAVVGMGATLLAAGDALGAYDRFERPVPGARVAVVALHDLAALLLVLGMLRA
jgi:hypothetical protein